MKRSIIIIFLFKSFLLSAQDSYLTIPEFVDKVAITHVVDSLRKEGKIGEYVVYQRQSEDRKVITFLIYNMADSSKLWLISNNTVKSQKSINARRVFGYKNILLTGAIAKEDKLKFVPPILSVINSENVLYFNVKKKVQFYYEYGKNITTYEPLIQRQKYRSELLVLIKQSTD